MRLLGYQVVDREYDNPPKGIMFTYEIYSLDYCLAFIKYNNRSQWRLLPVFAGDIEGVVDRTKLQYDTVELRSMSMMDVVNDTPIHHLPVSWTGKRQDAFPYAKAAGYTWKNSSTYLFGGYFVNRKTGDVLWMT